MAITIKPDVRLPLIEKLTDILSRVEIENNRFINYKIFYELTDLEETLEKKESGKLSKRFVTDSPLIDFFLEELSEEIQRTRKFDSTIQRYPLTQIEEYKNPSSLAERLVRDFESLPREYKIFIKLPVYGFVNILGTDRFELSNALNLVIPNDEFEATFKAPVYEPRRRTFSLFAKSPQEQTLYWEPYYVYSEITQQGFIGIYEDTAPLKRASYLVRALCGLGLALGLFGTGFSISIEDTYLSVYQKAGDEWASKKIRPLPTEFVQGLEKLNLAAAYEQTPGKISMRPTLILATLKKLFSDEEENEKLLRAAQWYFDSYCGDNELLSFVKAAICLEMLLGDKSESAKMGVMELLRNRCAYFIGSTRKEREQIIKDFNEIYSTRSDIVHNGQNILTKRERISLYKLRSLCARVINKEARIG
jgi:hypothetical protein